MKWIVVLALVVAGCSKKEAAPQAPATASSELAADERLLDTSADGQSLLVGKPHAVPANSDAALVFDVTWRRPGGAKALEKIGPVLDIRFVGNDRVAVVDIDARLVVIDLPDGEPKVLDKPVRAGIDYSPTCGCIAYMRGTETSTEPAIVNPANGTSSVVGTGFTPGWLPTLSPDGKSLILVSSRTGVAALWLVSTVDGSTKQLTNLGSPDPTALVPFPEGPDRPVWVGDVIVFQARGAVHVIGSDGGVRWSKAGLGVPRAVAGKVRFDGMARLHGAADLKEAP